MASVETDLLYEVVGGQRVELPPMGGFETFLASTLFRYLTIFVSERRIGWVVSESLFRLDEDGELERRPDLAFISYERLPRNRPIPERVSAVKVVPDLPIEVVSPSNTMSEVMGKVSEYFRAGAQHVWVILPDQRQVYDYSSTTRVQILGWDDELSGGEVIPGFSVRVSELFEDVLPPS